MTSGTPSTSRARAIALYLAMAGALLAILLALVVRPQGDAPPELLRFFGRFHSLLVHLPIGIVTLIALAELGSFSARVRSKIDPAIGFALPVLALTSVAAFSLGLLLARGGGYPSRLVSLHRGLTLAAIVMLPVCAALWLGPVQRLGNLGRWMYRGALGLALGLMSIGAHFGGSMTRGEDYLVQYAPKFARGWLGVKDTETFTETPMEPTSEPLVWEHSVKPLLKTHCVKCHGPKETKGGLRLDSLQAALKGGDDEGPSVVAGSAARSPLVKRMRLPVSDEDRMPPDGKAGPSEAEIALIGWWIDRGVNETLRMRDGVTPDGVAELLAKLLTQTATASSAAAAGGGAGAAGRAPSASAADGGAPAEVASDDDAEDDAEDNDAEDDDDDDSEFGPTPNYGSGDSSGSSGSSDSTQAVTHEPSPVWSHAVSPLLNARCGKCHGPKRQKGKFRVDSIAALTQGGKKDGPGVVPGATQTGSLLQRIRSTVKDKHMPPAKEPQLSALEIELLSWWIKQGANDTLSTSALPKNLAAKYGPAAASAAASPSAEQADAGAPDAEAKAEAEAEAKAEAKADAGTPKAKDGGGGTSTPSDAGVASHDAARDAGVTEATASVALYADVVAPILTKRCGACHTGESAMGALRIDDLAGMLAGGDIVPGEPEASPLLARQLVPLEELNHMPPKGEPQPQPWELEVIRLWIRDGADADARVARADLPPQAQPTATHSPDSSGDAGSDAATANAAPGAGVKTQPTSGCAACRVGLSAAAQDQPGGRASLAWLGAWLGAWLLLGWRRRAGRDA